MVDRLVEILFKDHPELHDERCESEFIFPPGAHTECLCAERFEATVPEKGGEPWPPATTA